MNQNPADHGGGCAGHAQNDMTTVFLLSLAGGILMVLATGRFDQIAWRFLRNATLVSAAILAGITSWRLAGGEHLPSPATLMGGVGGLIAAVSSFLAPLAASRPTMWRGCCLLAAVSSLAAAGIATAGLAGAEAASGGVQAAAIASQLAAAVLLGSITVSWLLGHAYLTATRMTIAPLRHFTRLLSWSVGARSITFLMLCGLGWFWSDAPGGLLADLSNAWLIVSLRVGVGLAAVALFSYMVADCVRSRSTQSATGILYFGSVFAYVGELCAIDFLIDYGWPL